MAGLRLFLSMIIFLFFLLVTIGTLLGALAPYVSPATSGIIALAGIALPFLLATNFFFIFYWLFRRKRWWIISLFVILINAHYLLSIYQFNSKGTEVVAGKEIKIATNNVQRFLTKHRATFNQVADWAAEEKIDVLCFQEYSELHFGSDSIKRIFKQYPYCSFFNTMTLAVYSKYPIIGSQGIDFQSQEAGGGWVDILLSGDTIRIFNVHLQTTNVSTNSREYNISQRTGNEPDKMVTVKNMISDLKLSFKERAKQAIGLMEMVDSTSYPTIICGDFNDTPMSYVYHKIKGDRIDGFQECGKGYGYTFKGFYKLLRIDYIFYSKDFKGVEYGSPSTTWSDHNPVVMKLIY